MKKIFQHFPFFGVPGKPVEQMKNHSDFICTNPEGKITLAAHSVKIFILGNALEFRHALHPFDNGFSEISALKHHHKINNQLALLPLN